MKISKSHGFLAPVILAVEVTLVCTWQWVSGSANNNWAYRVTVNIANNIMNWHHSEGCNIVQEQVQMELILEVANVDTCRMLPG